MASSCVININPRRTLFYVLAMAVLFGIARSDLAQDRAECTDSLIGLSTCLPYVGVESKAPTPNCCTGVKQVLAKSFKCVCILVKDGDDPQLGLKIDKSRALSLPSVCQSPVNISKCIDLLQLAPGSADAKMFSGYEESLEKANSTSQVPTPAATGTPSTAEKRSGVSPMSDGSRKKPWSGVFEVAIGAVIWAILINRQHILVDF